MIVRQTTTIVFEYPQDYLQEQEWCKTKEDRWIHKSTDTMCTVYENTISYSIGATADRKTEPQTEVVMPKKCKGCDSASKIIEAYSRGFEDGAEAAKAVNIKALHKDYKEPYVSIEQTEPQTDCAWK